MGAFVLHIPEARLRVGPRCRRRLRSKIYHYAEEAIVTWAAAKVKRPVKWTAERSESFMSDAHGRDHVTHIELALDGRVKFSRPQGFDHRQYGRLSIDLCSVHPDLPLWDAARQHLYDPGDLCRDQGCLHPHRAGRRLSRRGASGATFLLEAGRRPRGRRARNGPGRTAPPEFHREGRLPLRRPRSHCSTTAAITEPLSISR